MAPRSSTNRISSRNYRGLRTNFPAQQPIGFDFGLKSEPATPIQQQGLPPISDRCAPMLTSWS